MIQAIDLHACGEPGRVIVGGVADIVRIGKMVKAAAQEQLKVTHPLQPDFDGISIAQLSGPPLRRDAHRKNAVVVSTGKLDWNKP
ncbi:MAG: proline racemase family protein [Holophaga sp.]|jgi:proline racemase